MAGCAQGVAGIVERVQRIETGVAEVRVVTEE